MRGREERERENDGERKVDRTTKIKNKINEKRHHEITSYRHNKKNEPKKQR